MYIFPVIVFLVLVAADQIIKLVTVARLMPVENIDIIDNFFSLTYVENKGAAFGFLQGAKWLFIILTVVICIFCAVYYVRLKRENKNIWTRAAIVLICSGAVGNLADRLLRGYVVDMFNFYIFGWDFPVFNFADICVCIGAFLLAAGALFLDREE